MTSPHGVEFDLVRPLGTPESCVRDYRYSAPTKLTSTCTSYSRPTNTGRGCRVQMTRQPGACQPTCILVRNPGNMALANASVAEQTQGYDGESRTGSGRAAGLWRSARIATNRSLEYATSRRPFSPPGQLLSPLQAAPSPHCRRRPAPLAAPHHTIAPSPNARPRIPCATRLGLSSILVLS